MPGYRHKLLGKDPKEQANRLSTNRSDRQEPISELISNELGDAVEGAEADGALQE